MNFFVQKIKQSDFISNIFTLSVGSVVSQIIPIVASIVLARLYSPDDFGIWGVFSSYASILAVVGCARYEIAIVKPRKNIDVWNLAILCFIFSLGFCIFLSLIIGFDSIFELKILSDLMGNNVIYYLPLYVFILLLTQIISNVQNRFKLYRNTANLSIVRSSAQVVTRIGLGIPSGNAQGLIWGAIIGSLAYFILAWYKIRSVIGKMFYVISVKRIKVLMREYINFPKYDLLGALFNSLSANIPIILLAFFFSNTDVGFFSMAITILYIPMSFIGTAIGQVFYQRACEMVAKGQNIGLLTKQIFLFSFYVGYIPILLLIIGGETIFSFVLGAKWATSGVYSEFLSIWLFLVFCISPISNVFLVMDKQKTGMNINILMFLSRMVVILLGGLWLLDVNYTIILYSITGFLLWILQTFYVYRFAKMQLSSKESLIIWVLSTIMIGSYIIKICVRYI